MPAVLVCRYGFRTRHPTNTDWSTDGLEGLSQIFIGLNRANFSGQLLAGITLLAIAIPEQLATSQLAGVPLSPP